jgi:tetrapyrrole methylase family protein/MazG family protein
MNNSPADDFPAVKEAFAALYELALYLRSDVGCPWDREQNLESMHKFLLEEATELGEAIDAGNDEGISEEWGDVLFMLLMLAAIGKEADHFNTERAMRSIEAKMIRRHPHVFGRTDVNAVEGIISQWEKIKAEEKSSKPASLMDNMPPFYSSLRRADHVQKTAAKVGFDWPACEGTLEKIEEEVRELREAFTAGAQEEIAAELGDLMFSCVNLARYSKMDSEALLNRTVDKFVVRFKYIESELRRTGKSPQEATLDEMDALWEQSKEALRKKQD